MREVQNKETRKLTVTGSSGTYYITIPKKMIRNLKWKKGEKKTISQVGDKVVIEDWNNKQVSPSRTRACPRNFTTNNVIIGENIAWLLKKIDKEAPRRLKKEKN